MVLKGSSHASVAGTTLAAKTGSRSSDNFQHQVGVATLKRKRSEPARQRRVEGGQVRARGERRQRRRLPEVAGGIGQRFRRLFRRGGGNRLSQRREEVLAGHAAHLENQERGRGRTLRQAGNTRLRYVCTGSTSRGTNRPSLSRRAVRGRARLWRRGTPARSRPAFRPAA
jgi:hypothetical protein